MTVTSVEKDLEAATLTVVAEYPATLDQVWALWADPRKLERWWGPPTYPATVTDHDLRPGGMVRYYMTGPEGDRHGGGWRILEVHEPTRLVLEDHFENDDGTENTDLPRSSMVVSIEEVDSGVRMTVASRFASPEDMARVLEMGMEEGIKSALGQTDDLLGADRG